ncbi:MAG: hypothetical protein RLY43_145 [Bacteroidota bacterium]
MEPKFTTSFIPKKQVSATVTASGTGPAISFSTLLSSVIIIAVLLFSAGLFLFKLTVQATIEQQENTLEKVAESFDQNFIGQATRLNKRIISSQKILDNHLAPSAIFELLEEFTLQTISFNSFEFSDNVDGKIVVKGSGEGDSFASVVLQSDEFGKTGFMRDVLFSDLQPNAAGNVNFTFEATLDSDLVSYSRGVVPVETAPEELPAVEQLDTL